MEEINAVEIDEVSGGLTFTEGGVAVIGIGFAGGPVTGAFGLLVGGAMLFVGHYQK